MSRERMLHFDAVDVLAAAIHGVLDPIDDAQEPVVVDANHVTRTQPAGAESVQGGRVIAPVAGRHRRRADQEFAGALGVLVQQLELGSGRCQTDRMGMADGVLVRQRADAATGFGESVAGSQTRRGKRLDDLAHLLRRRGRASVADPAHRRRVERWELRMPQGLPEDGRHGGQQIDAFVGDRCQPAHPR